MATIHCHCGKEFSINEIPCQYEFHLIPNTGIDELTSKIIGLVNETEDVDLEVGYAIVNYGIAMFRCPYCSRLIVFWDGRNKPPRFYQSE